MVKPVDPTRVVEYVHPTDRAEGKPDGLLLTGATVWKVRGLTKRQRAALLDAATVGRPGAAGISMSSCSGALELKQVRWGLVGVDCFDQDFKTEDDPDWPGRKRPTDAFLDTIPDEVFRGIGSHVLQLSQLSEDDAGKSSRPST